MRKITLSFLLTVLTVGIIFAQNVQLSWAKSMGGNGSNIGQSIAIDVYGNIYTSGVFVDTIDFDPGNGIYNLVSVGSQDIFIQKLDSAGNFIWAKSMGAGFSDEGLSISLDASGNIFTTGHFRGPADFDPGSGTYYLSSVGNQGIFIQKLKPTKPISFTTATKDNSIKVSISPNPNNGSFTLSINNSNTKTNETYHIEIYDVIGNLLHREEIRGGSSVTTNMQMESLSKGLYFLSLKTKENILTTRFVVQ